MDYSLADLTKLTGAKRRSVQLWAEAGVVQADPGTERAGTGTHRRFSRKEAITACLVNAFAQRLQMPVGVLLHLSKVIRLILDQEPSWIDRAIKNEGNIYLIIKGQGLSDNPEPDVDGFNAGLFGFAAVDTGEREVWKQVTRHLNEPGAFSIAIMANPYLRGFA
jgi:hypothetical protein